MAANLGTREMDYRFMMLITINHQVMHAAFKQARKLARFISVSSWNCENAAMLLICFRTSYVSISKSTTHPRPALGQTSASPTTSPSAGQVQSQQWQQSQQCDFEGIFCPFVFGICLKIVRFHHHHPSGTLHLPGWRKLSVFPSSCSYIALEPWRMLACRCGLCCRKWIV